MAVNINNVEQVLESELKITKEEAELFVLLIFNGKLDKTKAARMLEWNVDNTDRVAKSLINRGMIIDLTKTEYESLHPRFAITNRYRNRCEEDNIAFKKNRRVDNIGMLLEGPYNDARTK
jgi:predicted transcriptional regulator